MAKSARKKKATTEISPQGVSPVDRQKITDAVSAILALLADDRLPIELPVGSEARNALEQILADHSEPS